jgi:hypothetical protein
MEFLQEPDVEHIMETSLWWKLEVDNNIVDQLGDAVGPEVACLELARGRLGHGRYRSLTEAEQHQIIHFVQDVAVVLVVVALLNRLRGTPGAPPCS